MTHALGLYSSNNGKIVYYNCLFQCVAINRNCYCLLIAFSHCLKLFLKMSKKNHYWMK